VAITAIHDTAGYPVENPYPNTINSGQEGLEQKHRSRFGTISKHKLNQLLRCLRAENQLHDRDWNVLQHPESILTVFETMVKTLEGDGQLRTRRHGWPESYGNIWDVLLGFELLLGKLEEFKQLATEFPDAKQFRIGVNMAWEKLNKYYRLLDETPIYYTALALHPAYRWDWFNEIWREKPDWVRKAKAMVQEVWMGEYAQLDVHASSQESE
jgi:hypothetical protein